MYNNYYKDWNRKESKTTEGLKDIHISQIEAHRRPNPIKPEEYSSQEPGIRGLPPHMLQSGVVVDHQIGAGELNADFKTSPKITRPYLPEHGHKAFITSTGNRIDFASIKAFLSERSSFHSIKQLSSYRLLGSAPRIQGSKLT